MLVFSKNRKILCFWTLGTSILTSEKNYPNVFCSAFPNLPNAVFRFSLTCVVFEIVGRGAEINPPPGRWCSAETTGCARVNSWFVAPICMTLHLVVPIQWQLPHLSPLNRAYFNMLTGEAIASQSS